MISKVSPSLANPAAKLFAGIAIGSALVLYGVVRFPASVSDGGICAFLLTAAGLLTYALAAHVADRSGHYHG